MDAPAGATAARIDRRGLFLLLAIAAIALGVRLGVAYVQGFGAPLSGDEIDYADAASSLAAGHGFALKGIPIARRMPGWPMVLAGPYMAFGPGPAVARLTACILGALTTLALGFAAFRAAGLTAAILAACGAAFYPPMILYSAQVLTETPTVFWLALALWLFFEGRSRDGWAWFVGSGLAFGMSCLTRGTVIAFLWAACLALLAAPSSGWIVALGRTAALTAGAALVLSPWIVRNAVVLGRPTLSTQSETQLWQGAHTGATGLNRIDWARTKEKFAELGNMSEVEKSDVMGREAKVFIREHPVEFARLGFVKAWELWKPWSRQNSLVENLGYALAALPLMIVGIASAFHRGRTRSDRVFLLGGLALFTLLHMLYTAVVRYRVPADAVLILYGAVFLAGIMAPRVPAAIFKAGKNASLPPADGLRRSR